MTAALLPFLGLLQRELLHFVRQPTRMVSAAASPLLFWVLIGSGFSGSFRLPGGGGGSDSAAGIDYLQYFFPGTLLLLVLFSAIFSTISVIDDRQNGFLQGALVSPASGRAIVLGKVLGGALLAWIQGVLLLLIAPWIGVPMTTARTLAACGILALLAVGLTSLGFACAWRTHSTQGFHGIMNLLLVPMWLLSGALFPLSGAPTWLQVVARLNPLTYGLHLFRSALQPAAALDSGLFASPLLPWCVTLAFTLVALGLALATVRERSRL
ncbi:MAG: ABC transporter permease [Thermoanaerobaculia bacterium]|nr:ABC transporter permease [Thermoanaerobaculia bacterium]